MAKETNPFYKANKKNTLKKYFLLFVGALFLLNSLLVLTGSEADNFTIIGFEVSKITYLFFYLAAGVSTIWSGLQAGTEKVEETVAD